MMAARNRHIGRRIVTRIRSVLLLTLPGDDRRQETARHFQAQRGAAVLSGVRSAPHRRGRNCRSAARIQYVAVLSGWGVDAQRKQAMLNPLLGTTTIVPQGGVLWVFAVK